MRRRIVGSSVVAMLALGTAAAWKLSRGSEDPFPFNDEPRVRAEAEILLKADETDPRVLPSQRALANAQQRHPNDPESAHEEALAFFKLGVRNRWRFATRVFERARETGYPDEVAAEALRSTEPLSCSGRKPFTLSFYMGTDMWNGIQPQKFDKEILEGGFGSWTTTAVIEDALRRAARKLGARQK